MFGSVFWFSHLKTAVFQFWGLPRFAGFLEFSLWFSVFVNNDSGFCPVRFTVFLVLPRKLHPPVALKPAYFQAPFSWHSTLSFRGKDDRAESVWQPLFGNIKAKDYFSNIARLE